MYRNAWSEKLKQGKSTLELDHELKRGRKLYIFMIHMPQKLNLSKRSLGINPVIKCIADLLYSDLLSRLGIDCRTAHSKNDPKKVELVFVKAIERI
jgi:hypothetical protein